MVSPTGAPSESFTLAHISDTHLHYQAFKDESSPGVNTRGRDVVKAFRRAIDDIVKADPPLVIHSGDVFESPHPDATFQKEAQLGFRKLAGIRPNGTRRQVVIISGNHDQPYRLDKLCVLEMLDGLPGIHVTTVGYKQVSLDPSENPIATGADPVLANTVVHCVPHDSLKRLDQFEPVKEIPGRVNILTTHGIPEGSELDRRNQGREFPIPMEMMLRNWEYGAFGHIHTCGPVHIAGAAKGSQSNLWFAGSTEFITFRDQKKPGTESNIRYWLEVTINPGSMPEVAKREIEVRRYIRLPEIDASKLNEIELADAMKGNLQAATISRAVVGQPVINARRDIYALVDMASVRRAAADALYYDPQIRFVGSADVSDASIAETVDPTHGISEIIAARAEATVPEGDRVEVTAYAERLVKEALKIEEIEAAKETAALPEKGAA